VIDEKRVQLGLALGQRASEPVDRSSALLAADTMGGVVPSEAYEEHRRGRTLMATLLVARWLVTGEPANQAEQAWISLGGRMAADEGLPMASVTRGYYSWRDGALEVIQEEGGRLGCSAALVAEASAVVRKSFDVSLLRMLRSYDDQLRAATQSLATNEARLAGIIRSAPIGLFAIDSAGRWLLLRGSVLDQLCSEKLVVGRHFSEVAEELPGLVAAIRKAQAVGDSVSTFTLGSLEIALDLRVHQPTDAEAEALTGVLVDVSERRRAEEARRESDAKTRFLAKMSHELRTPLNGILGFAQLLALRSGELDPQQERYVTNIRTSGEHLLSLINEVLDLVQIQSGDLKVQLEPVDAAAVVARAAAKVKPQATARGLRLALPAKSPCWVMADALRVEQVLEKLLNNAVKFTGDGGDVGVEIGREGEMVAIRVSDSGLGIPDDQVERVFEEFTQVGTGPTREHGGTGLGLPLSRRMAELMGGSIRVTSRHGSGSLFTLTLQPAKAPAKVARTFPK
jgi:signal transduction histidine kinase